MHLRFAILAIVMSVPVGALAQNQPTRTELSPTYQRLSNRMESLRAAQTPGQDRELTQCLIEFPTIAPKETVKEITVTFPNVARTMYASHLEVWANIQRRKKFGSGNDVDNLIVDIIKLDRFIESETNKYYDKIEKIKFNCINSRRQSLFKRAVLVFIGIRAMNILKKYTLKLSRWLITSEMAYFIFTGIMIISISWYISNSIRENSSGSSSIGNDEVYLIFSTIFIFLISIFWGVKIWKKIFDAGSKFSASLGDVGGNESELFRNLLDGYYNPSLSEGIIHYEKFCRHEYDVDLRRHALSYILVFLSSMIAIGMGFFIVMRYSQATEDLTGIKDVISALGGILPGVVSATTLKMWLETRTNLLRTRARVHDVLRQKMRVMIALGRKRGESEWIDEELVRAQDILDYIQGTGSPSSVGAHDEEAAV